MSQTLPCPPATLAERIAFLRQLASVPARRLSILAGRSHGLVALIESGGNENTTIGTLRQIAKVLGCNEGWLLAGLGPVAPRVDVDLEHTLRLPESERLQSLAPLKEHVVAAVTAAEQRLPAAATRAA